MRCCCFDAVRRSIVSCLRSTDAVRVQQEVALNGLALGSFPVTPSNKCRYFQGIKFYEPELASDTPKAVEYDGMQALLAATAEHLGQVDGKVLLSPGAPALVCVCVCFRSVLSCALGATTTCTGLAAARHIRARRCQLL